HLNSLSSLWISCLKDYAKLKVENLNSITELELDGNLLNFSQLIFPFYESGFISILNAINVLIEEKHPITLNSLQYKCLNSSQGINKTFHIIFGLAFQVISCPFSDSTLICISTISNLLNESIVKSEIDKKFQKFFVFIYFTFILDILTTETENAPKALLSLRSLLESINPELKKKCSSNFNVLFKSNLSTRNIVLASVIYLSNGVTNKTAMESLLNLKKVELSNPDSEIITLIFQSIRSLFSLSLKENLSSISTYYIANLMPVLCNMQHYQQEVFKTISTVYNIYPRKTQYRILLGEQFLSLFLPVSSSMLQGNNTDFVVPQLLTWAASHPAAFKSALNMLNEQSKISIENAFKVHLMKKHEDSQPSIQLKSSF
ncbi:hypothetical protein ROZALSC1DRAFT_24432, partial [Rozella allomycis CSF55]